MTLFPIRRVAIIYNDVPRPETTGGYVLRALQRLVTAGELEAVVHVLPGEIERLIAQPFDLYLVIDDGLGCALPADFCPWAYWTIDTHVDFEPRLVQARAFDFVFAAQKNGAERLRQAGIATARWLPLACDPEIHGKQEVAKQYDFAFVGNLFPGPRTELLERLRRKYRNVWIGNADFQEMARIHSAARRIFNCCIGGLRRDGDLNMRTFEALASGSPLIPNDLGENGQDSLDNRPEYGLVKAGSGGHFPCHARPQVHASPRLPKRGECARRRPHRGSGGASPHRPRPHRPPSPTTASRSTGSSAV